MLFCRSVTPADFDFFLEAEIGEMLEAVKRRLFESFSKSPSEFGFDEPQRRFPGFCHRLAETLVQTQIVTNRVLPA